jgi:hypothetical protein
MLKVYIKAEGAQMLVKHALLWDSERVSKEECIAEGIII